MKIIKRIHLLALLAAALSFLFITCVTNPITGESTMALVSNDMLFPMSFQQYSEFLSENKVIKGTSDAQMVERVGKNIRAAAEKWFAAEGKSDYLRDYQWEYNLVDSKDINAWCMPGGKIVVYTGLLPITKNEDALAVVLGHEVAHALLNHGQQRMSASVLQEVGAAGLSVLTSGTSEGTQLAFTLAYGVGSTYLGVLPFSRSHESEADHYGLILMAIAGYNPDEAVPLWQRMSAASGGDYMDFLSTHPTYSTRINQLREWIPEARNKARELGR